MVFPKLPQDVAAKQAQVWQDLITSMRVKFTIKQIAESLGVSESYVRRHSNNPKPPATTN